jgi:hypothetical protein
MAAVRVPRVPRDPEIRRLRARVAQAARCHPDQPELVADDRRALKARVAEQYVRDLVDTWPPLTDNQRGRLAALLTGAREEAGDGA